mgnify:CR=1 FL=1
MKALVYFQPNNNNAIFEGARLRKTIKGALELNDIEHTSNLLDTYNIVHLISPDDEHVLNDAKEYHLPVVVSALYTEDDPSACYLEEVVNKDTKLTVLKPKALKFLNEADLVLVPCEDACNFLKEKGVTTPIKISPLGINMSRFDFSRDDEKEIFYRYFREDRNKKLVLAVGEFEPKMNGTSSFINSAKKNPDAIFYYIGRLTRTIKINFKFRKFLKNAPNNVKFVSDLPDDVYRSALLNASVFLIPGYKKAGVVSIYEAMAAKCQIIARKCALFNGIIQEGITGHIGEFSETLSSLTRDCLEGKIKPTTAKAYEEVSALTLEKLGEELKVIYQDLINDMGGVKNDCDRFDRGYGFREEYCSEIYQKFGHQCF